MRTKFLKLAIAIIVFFLTQDMHANHITSGEISYKCLGGNTSTYEVNLSVYTECTTTKNDPYFDIIYYSESLGGKRDALSPKTFRVNLVSQSEVKLYCEGKVSNCNGGNTRGIRKYNYSGVVILPKVAPDWVFLFKQASRSFDITTSQISFESDFILEAHLNTVLAPCNSSPQFDINSSIVKTVEVNKELSLNLSAIDLEGDQLKYSISSPLVNFSTPMTYKTGFNANDFISSSTKPVINNQGFLNIKPSLPEQVGVTDIKIEEYRNGKLIGSTTRNIQFISINSENNIPSLSNWVDDKGKELQVDTLFFCEGEEIIEPEYNIQASDLDEKDVIAMDFSSPYASWFVFNEKKVSLFHTFSNSEIGLHIIKLKAEDNHCPNNASTEKLFYIRVNPKPIFDLGSDYDINCALPKVLSPTIDPKTGTSFTYEWRTLIPITFPVVTDIDLGVFSTVSTFAPTRISKTKLKVTNEFGCVAFDSVLSKSDLELNSITYTGQCFVAGQTHEVIYEGPVSTQFKNGIVSYEWSFDSGLQTSTNKNLVVSISEPGAYSVSLKVTDSLGCTDELSFTDVVCEKHETVFDVLGICEGTNFVFTDLTKYSEACEESVIRPRVRASWDFGDGNRLEQGGNSTTQVFHTYDTTGKFTATLISESAHFCKDTTSLEVTVFPQPKIDFFQSDVLYRVCNNPDTLLAIVDLQKGTGVQEYTWLYNFGYNKLDTLHIGSDTTISVSKTGEYTVYVRDEKGCQNITYLNIEEPAEAKFNYSPVCSGGDTMKLIDQSKSATPIVQREWQIGAFTASDSIVNFVTSIPNRYSLKLKIEDSNGCKDSLSAFVNYLFVDSSAFFIQSQNISICATDLVPANSFGPQKGFKNIYESQWSVGLGDTIKNKAGAYKLTFPNLGDYTVYHKVIYNVDTNSTGFCIADTSIKISVLPEFKIEVFYNRVCQYDSAFFNIERIAGDTSVPIIATRWILQNLDKSVRDTINSKSFKYTVDESGTYQILVTAEDANGCKVVQNSSATASSTLSRPEISFLTNKKICANEIGKFSAGVIQDANVESISNYALVINQDTVVNGIGNPRTFDVQYKFDKTRKNTATIYLVDLKAHVSSPQYEISDANACRASKAIEFELIDLPILDVKADTMCPKASVTISNLSKASPYSGAISSFSVLESGKFATYPSSQTEWKKSYPVGGYNTFVLVVKTDSGCVDTLKKDIFVKPGPVADFDLMERFPEAFIPLSIFDVSKASIGLANDTAQLISSFYDLGDGATSNAFDLTHTWNEVKAYQVEHQVENSYGCRDTIIKTLDMRPYLDAPNAFTPNGDGTNDFLGLIYKSIIDLQDYKIYNRWGQVVFDGGNDLDAVWDGKFKGVDQEVGVYVLHVVGKGTYNTDYNFKKNLNLIR